MDEAFFKGLNKKVNSLIFSSAISRFIHGSINEGT